MTLGRHTKNFLNSLKQDASAESVLLKDIPLGELRKSTIEIFKDYAGSLPDGIKEENFTDLHFQTSDGKSVQAKHYRPKNFDADQGATVIFLPGNGFLFDMTAAHLPGVARLALAASCQVILLNTPLAPEHSAQQINQQCYEVVKTIFDDALLFNIDKNNMLLAGYSCGGNIACNILKKSSTDPDIKFNQLILLSPSLDISLKTFIDNPYTKYQEKDETVVFENLQFITQSYYQDNDPTDPFISPLYETDFNHLPPITIILAEYDADRGVGHAYAEKLKAASVEVQVKICAGQIHNYFIARGVLNDEPDPALVMAEVILER